MVSLDFTRIDQVKPIVTGFYLVFPRHIRFRSLFSGVDRFCLVLLGFVLDNCDEFSRFFFIVCIFVTAPGANTSASTGPSTSCLGSAESTSKSSSKSSSESSSESTGQSSWKSKRRGHSAGAGGGQQTPTTSATSATSAAAAHGVGRDDAHRQVPSFYLVFLSSATPSSPLIQGCPVLTEFHLSFT